MKFRPIVVCTSHHVHSVFTFCVAYNLAACLAVWRLGLAAWLACVAAAAVAQVLTAATVRRTPTQTRPVGRKRNGGGVFFVKNSGPFPHKMKRNWIKLCVVIYDSDQLFTINDLHSRNANVTFQS